STLSVSFRGRGSGGSDPPGPGGDSRGGEPSWTFCASERLSTRIPPPAPAGGGVGVAWGRPGGAGVRGGGGPGRAGGRAGRGGGQGGGGRAGGWRWVGAGAAGGGGGPEVAAGACGGG